MMESAGAVVAAPPTRAFSTKPASPSTSNEFRIFIKSQKHQQTPGAQSPRIHFC